MHHSVQRDCMCEPHALAACMCQIVTMRTEILHMYRWYTSCDIVVTRAGVYIDTHAVVQDFCSCLTIVHVKHTVSVMQVVPICEEVTLQSQVSVVACV